MHLKDLPLTPTARCANHPCRYRRHGYDIYCQECRTAMTAAIEWLKIETGTAVEEPAT